MRYILLTVLTFFQASFLMGRGFYHPNDTSNKLNLEAYHLLGLPKLTRAPKRKILIAIVDDGFNLNHKAIQPFLFRNSKEINGNGLDDDDNGYIDDVAGWDVSDADNDVTIPVGMEYEYFHGTFVAGVITSLMREVYGDNAEKYFKILPVKVLADKSTRTEIKDGYEGIRYATTMGADIICCPWSGGQPRSADREAVNQALLKGIMLVASAGNESKKEVGFPSAFSGVLCVSALDKQLRKLKTANYGVDVDLSLPGDSVKAAHPIANNAYFYGSKTSAACALATGVMAVLQSSVKSSINADLMEALKNTALPIDSLNRRYCGRLGAGLPNLKQAMGYLNNKHYRNQFFDSNKSQGVINVNTKYRRLWQIKPHGTYEGVLLTARNVSVHNLNKPVLIRQNKRIIMETDLKQVKEGILAIGNNISLSLDEGSIKGVKIDYQMKCIDSTILYCSGIQEMPIGNGVLTDGSENRHYANNCSCKWTLTVPEGKRIHLSFDEFDTQAKVDYVWLFDGHTTQQTGLIAKLSGPKIPPEIYSRSNKVLVWFVTDANVTGKGWSLKYEVVE